MSYASGDELRSRLGKSIFEEIYNLSGELATAELGEAGSDLSEVSDDLESAASEIDGALVSRYALPITGSKSLKLLKDWNLTLAEERAYARPVGGDFTEKIKRRVDIVRKYLEEIRLGQYLLPDAVEKSAAPGKSIALIQRSEPVFGRENMEGF